MAVKGKQKMAAVETSNFTTLASVDVSKFTKSRSGRKYLSWSHAAHQLLRHFPQAEMEVVTNEEGHPFFKTELGYFVHCKVTVEGITREQWYPVWDNKYETIGTPTASDINNSIQRGMTKTIALHGLGLHVYANEDLPLEEVVAEDAKEELAGVEDVDPVVLTSAASEPVEADSNGDGKVELISSLAERQKAWSEMQVEAMNRFRGKTEKDGKQVDTWKVEVQKKLEGMYGPERAWTVVSPQHTLEASELYQAFKELFPDLVDEG